MSCARCGATDHDVSRCTWPVNSPHPITVTLPYPLSANRYWASRVAKVKGKPMPIVYVTSEAQAYKKDVAWRAQLAGIPRPLVGRVQVHVQLYPHRPLDWQARQRKHGQAWDDTVQCLDLDNCRKVLYDALKGVAFEDDKWVRKDSAERMEPDEHGARVVVTIRPLMGEPVQKDLLA